MPEAALTVRDNAYRWPIRALNGVAAVADAIGLPIGNCDPASILRAARGRGPGDWGDDAFQTPMNLLCDAVRENGRLTPLARVVMRQSFIRAVKNRLELQACLQRHPDIEQTRIERPIFVLGFPRTGTTVLQNLPSEVKAARAKLSGEVEKLRAVSAASSAPRA